MRLNRILLLSSIFVFLFSVTCLLHSYVKNNSTKIQILEKFIEKEQENNEIVKTNHAFSPHCCPSTYSSDRGCMCVNDDYKKMLATRGNNRTGTNALNLYEDI